MAISRAAVLQSLVLDESLRQYQTAAVNSVQNLASTFTGIAHALQKQKVQTTQHEQSIQKQLNALVVTINEHAATIEDMKADQQAFSTRIFERLKYDSAGRYGGLGGGGSGPMSQKSLLDRIRRIERALDIVDSEDDYEDEDVLGNYDSNETSSELQVEGEPKSLRREASATNGHATSPSAPTDSELGATEASSALVAAPQQVISAGRRATSRASAPAAASNDPAYQPASSQTQVALSNMSLTTDNASPSPMAGKRSPRSNKVGGSRKVAGRGGSSATDGTNTLGTATPGVGVLSIASRLETLEYRQKQFEAFLKSQSGSHVDARLQAVLTESEPAVIKSRTEAAQKLDQMWRALERMENMVQGFSERMQTLESMVMQASDQIRAAVSEQAAERSKLGEHVAEALARLEDTRTELRERTEGLQSSVNAEIEEQARALGDFQQKLESKADIRLVLDKITRQEWQSVVNELKRADEEILSRAASRGEVEELVFRLRSDLTEEEQQRSANIVRIANDLKALMSEVSSKASKSDLVDVANVLNSFPKVHADLDSLKLFVEREIASKQDLQLLQDATVTRKGLRRQLDALLKSLAEEIHRGERAGLLPSGLGGLGIPHRGGGPCNSCLTRTASGPGGTCLVCSAKLLAPVGAGPHSARSTASAGGNGLGNPAFVPMKGGGYALTSSPHRTLGTTSLSASGTSIPPPGVVSGGQYTATSSAGAPLHPSSDNVAGTSRPLTANLTDFIAGKSQTMSRDNPGYNSARSVVGSDGRLYTSTGSRTHNLQIKR